MNIHYFQRYHQKENVATANTMLLLSRLYQYSPAKFFRVLKSELFSDSFEPELVLGLQEKGINSVPDAVIKQNSFKVVIETKTTGSYRIDQLKNHLNSFNDENYKVLVTLAPELMDNKKKEKFEEELRKFNNNQKTPVSHVNTTFNALAQAIQDVIDDRDYEMKEVIDDYWNYCQDDGLLPKADSKKIMRMQLANKTFSFNITNNVYYDNAERRFRAHDYLGLYSQKSIKAIGKISARITAVEEAGKMIYEAEYGDLTDARKKAIENAIKNSDDLGYNIRPIKHRYFFVEKFYDTDFKKITKYAPMGSRIFDLTEVLGTKTIPKTTEEIAEKLKNKTWE